MDDLSGVSERVNPGLIKPYRRLLGPIQPLPFLISPGADNIGIVFGEDCYDTIVQGMTLQLRNGLKRTPTISG